MTEADKREREPDDPSNFKKFEHALKRVLSVPKKVVDDAMAKEKDEQGAEHTEQPK